MLAITEERSKYLLTIKKYVSTVLKRINKYVSERINNLIRIKKFREIPY